MNSTLCDTVKYINSQGRTNKAWRLIPIEVPVDQSLATLVFRARVSYLDLVFIFLCEFGECELGKKQFFIASIFYFVTDTYIEVTDTSWAPFPTLLWSYVLFTKRGTQCCFVKTKVIQAINSLCFLIQNNIYFWGVRFDWYKIISFAVYCLLI